MRYSFLLLLLIVGCSGSNSPEVTIVHVRNRPYVDPTDFAASLRKENPDLADEQIDARYEVFLKDMEAMQKEQLQMLRSLVKLHRIKEVYYEGVTDETLEDFRKEVLKIVQANLLLENAKQRKFSNKDLRIAHQIVEETFGLKRSNRLMMGAVGEMLASGELKDVLPLEVAARIDFGISNESREDEMAQRLLKGGRVAIVVLGGDHDLSDNLKKYSESYSYEVQEPAMYQGMTDRNAR